MTFSFDFFIFPSISIFVPFYFSLYTFSLSISLKHLFNPSFSFFCSYFVSERFFFNFPRRLVSIFRQLSHVFFFSLNFSPSLFCYHTGLFSTLFIHFLFHLGISSLFLHFLYYSISLSLSLSLIFSTIPPPHYNFYIYILYFPLSRSPIFLFLEAY